MNAKRALVVISIVVCSAGIASAQTEWVDHPDNPVIGPGEPGSWDDEDRSVTGVVWDGSMYHMIFVGFAQDPDEWPKVGHATSPDGVVWTMDPNNPVLTAGADGEWDDVYVWGGPLTHDGTGFHLWYTGYDGEHERIGYATSPDGSVWTKYESNPVVDIGPPGSFDEHHAWPWSVVVADGTHRMWYTGQDFAGGSRIGYADSSDGISWTKHPTPVLEVGPGWDSANIWTPAVVFDGSLFHMWYAGNDGQSHTAIGYAWSGDGIEWTKHRYNPVVTVPVGRGASNCGVVFDGSTYHMWYTAFSATDPALINYATSNVGPGVPALDKWQFIPAAAVAEGSEGAFFQTDVDVSNADSRMAEYQFLWLPRGEDNSEPTTSEIFTLEAGMCVRYANVLTEVFGLEPNSFGALAITSSSPDLLAMSRTYNLGQADAGGTFGQAMPAITTGEFIEHGETRRLLFGTETTDMRTNIGCQNGNDATTIVYLDLFDDQGTSLGRKTMMLRASGNDQINRIFDGYQPVNGYVDVSVALAGNRAYCYGSVLDNVTSDPTTIPPQ
jgi:predicted GH43/DUF377 family glycosyl hydrolase